MNSSHPSVLHPKRFLLWGVLLCAASVTVLLYPMWAHGTAPTFTQWSTPTAIAGLNGISVGPDNDLWTAEYNANKVAKFNPTTQTFTEYTVPKVPGNSGTTMGPLYITKGPDNNMWFVDALGPAVDKVTTGGSFTQYPLNTAQFLDPQNIVVIGSDIWFSSFHGPYDLGEMDTNGNLLNEYIPDSGPAGKGIEGMSLGPDGNLWFAERNANKIAKFNLTTDVFTEYPVSTQPYWTAPGPDGDVWFAGTSNEPQFLGKINPNTGQISTYNIPSGTSPGQPVSGPGSKIYFAERGGGQAGSTVGVGVIDPTSGSISEYSTPTVANSGLPSFTVVGPDNNIWYADDNDVIGVMSGLTVSATPTPTPTTTHTPTPTPTVTPTPKASATPKPSGTPVADGGSPTKVGICHATGSTTNPYEYIVVDANAVQAFTKDPNDIFGVGSATDCPTSLVTSTPGTTLLNSDLNYVTTKGSTQDLDTGQAVAFLVDRTNIKGDEHHTATVKDVGANYADLVVQSQPIQVHLVVGQTKTVDVDQDGQPPISVELASISGSKANLVFRALSTTVVSAAIPSAKQATTKTTTGGLKTWQMAAIGGLAVGILLIVIELVMLFMKRKRITNNTPRPAVVTIAPTPPAVPNVVTPTPESPVDAKSTDSASDQTSPE